MAVATGTMAEDAAGDRGSRNKPDSTGTARLRGKAAAEHLPDGPVDEEVQEDLLEAFRAQQESQEVLFSSLLVIVSLPLFIFFICHSYWHLVDPWPWPFSGLKEADQVGRKVASVAHILTGLAVVSSFISTLAQQKLRSLRKPLLVIACILVLVAGVAWLRILLSIPVFPWDYAGLLLAALLGPLFLQWYVMGIWESTRREIRNLEGLKYRCHTA